MPCDCGPNPGLTEREAHNERGGHILCDLLRSMMKKEREKFYNKIDGLEEWWKVHLAYEAKDRQTEENTRKFREEMYSRQLVEAKKELRKLKLK